MNAEKPDEFAFYCISETDEVSAESENFVAPYLDNLKLNFMIQLCLTIMSILTITASFLPVFRCCNCLVWNFGNIAHIVGLVMLTMWRFSEDAEICSTEASAVEAGRKVDQIAID